MKPTTNLYLAHAAVAGANIIYGLNFNIAKSVMPLYLGPQALSVLRIVGASALFWILSLWQTTGLGSFTIFPGVVKTIRPLPYSSPMIAT